MTKDANQSIDRAFAILDLLKDKSNGLGVSEIAKKVGLTTTTTHRFLQALAKNRYVAQDDQSRKYKLGIACLELGSVFLRQNDIRNLAFPYLSSLRDECKETVHLAVLDAPDIVYIEKLDALLPIGFTGSYVGRRAPAYCTALGKSFLAYLPEQEVASLLEGKDLPALTPHTIRTLPALVAELARIRDQGYSLDNQEIQMGVKCIAVPVWKHAGEPLAAISVAGPVDRVEHAILHEKLIDKVINTGLQISKRLSVMAENPTANRGW